MGTGYTRQSAALIVPSATITSAAHNAEFNQLANAFDGTSGHTHDGSTGGGQKISMISGVTGTLPLANGGTNATTANAAATSILAAGGTISGTFDATGAVISGVTLSGTINNRGTISGGIITALVTPLGVASGGTGVSSASVNTVFAGPSTGAAAAPAFRTLVGAEAAIVLISAVTFSATSGPILFANGIDNSYNKLEFVLGFTTSATASLELQASTNSGSSYLSGASNYSYVLDGANANAGPISGASTTASSMPIMGSIATGTSTKASTICVYRDGGNSFGTVLDSRSTYFASPGPALATYTVACAVTVAGVMNAFQFIISGGALTGSIRLYGYRKT